MPDEEKTMMEVNDEAPESESKSSSLMTMVKKYGIYGAIIVVMMAAAYFVTLKVVKPMFGGGSDTAEVADHGAGKKADGKTEDGGRGHGSGDESEATGPGDIYMVKDIIVNPSGTGGTRYLSTSIGFELESAAAADLFSQRDAIVRDALITVLSSQSIPQLNDFKQRERLRQLIKSRVEKLLQTEDIAAVYFTEFVLQ